MLFAQGFSITIAGHRCLNQRHHGVECSHCVAHCPAKAITSYQNQVYLNQDHCNGCGLCLSDCPTQVFSSDQWDETVLINDIEEEQWKRTEFFCGKHSLPYKKDKNRDIGAVQLPVCLSAVSKGAWYELGLKTEIALHLDQCEGCPMANTMARLEFNIGTAAEWLEASAHTPQFSYIYQSSKGPSKRSLEAIETGLKVTSRRDLFLSLLGRGRQISEGRGEKAKEFPKELDEGHRSGCLPEWQIRMARVYSPKRVEGPPGREESPAAYWPTITMNERCVNCGMCSNFCPSGTLQTIVKDGVCSHYFTSGLCLDCRICQLFCPRGAISRAREKVEEPFARETIYSAKVIHCRRCGNIAVANANGLCFWCREEAANTNELNERCKELLLR